ncbi:MAG: aldehyde dehydrogenase family protein [Myxococcales bacterium]|nr:aldehyde dehydrogenase family protein [Myxococcales bacterium]
MGRFSFSKSSIDEAVQAAHRGAIYWRRHGRAERAKSVRKFRDLLSKRKDRLAALITRETGKPLWESRQEVTTSIRAVDLLLEEGMALLEPRILNEQEARSDYRPRGVVAAIAPPTLPLLIPTLHATAALLAGNTMVFKPSKFTPAVGQAVAETFDRCRLPRGTFNLVQGPGQGIGEGLAAHPGIDALLFNGAYATAVELRKATATRPELPMFLQCGGKGAAIVVGGCDMERAVYEVMVGAFLTAGQRGNSTGRVIVTDDVYDWFVDELVRRIQRITIGYGFDDGCFMGPLISENLRTRYRRYGRALVERGHTPILEAADHEVHHRRGFYAAPALYGIDWQNGHGFINEEPPGPTLLIYRVQSWEDAAALHNQLVYRVSTSVFVPTDMPQLSEFVGRLRTGALNMNRGTIGASRRLPAVGLGRASNGIPGGIDLLRFLTAPRSTLVESRAFDSSQVVPGLNWNEGEDETATDDELGPHLLSPDADATVTVGADVPMALGIPSDGTSAE